jgi:uroporphyrin-III C-methyltransferase/precorrin-2 dehydrogenase/sirohydrochlorin ferrochelatase
VEHARSGAHVVRLKGGDCTVFARLDEEIDALDAHGLTWHITPGITAASAGVAALGQSMTKRGRNASVRFLTGHDLKGFADHDWESLAKPNEVAAIYMGKKSARFVQGRLLMFGASPQTEISIVENASRSDMRILETNLGDLVETLRSNDVTGPALIFYGLAPRQAQILSHPQKMEFA